MACSQSKRNIQRIRRQATGKQPQGVEKPQPRRSSARLRHKNEGTSATVVADFRCRANKSKALYRSLFPEPEAVTLSCLSPEPEANRWPERRRKRPLEIDVSRDSPQKRQRAGITGNRPRADISDNRHSKQRETLRQTPQQKNTCDPVAYWARTSFWPKGLLQRGLGMDGEKPPKRRKSETTHRSSVVRHLAEHGISMDDSDLIHKDSKELCKKLLKGKRINVKTSIYTVKQFARVLRRVRDLSESRIVRDVTPWIVPSAEVLWFLNELKLDYIGDGLSGEWTRCATMGSTKPKPDYIAALLKQAYTQEEIDKLENYTTSERLFWFTPELSFPFLICEAKPAAVELNKADWQNIHSGSIAVRAILALYQEAFGHTAPHRVHELYGKILVFSVSHNHDQVSLYGHFAVAESDSLKYYRYLIDLFSLTARDGENQYKAYNFVYNVYEKFAPAHLKRIKDAVAYLPTPVQRTRLSFATAEMSVDELNWEQDFQEAASQGEGQMMPPPSIPNTAEREQIRMLEEQVSRMNEENEQMNARLNSFIKSNLHNSVGNESEAVRMLRQELRRQQQDNERQREELDRQRQDNERQRKELDRQRQDDERQREEHKREIEKQQDQMSNLMETLRSLSAQLKRLDGATGGLNMKDAEPPAQPVESPAELSLGDPTTTQQALGPTPGEHLEALATSTN